MPKLAAGVNRIMYEEETGRSYDYGNLVRSSKKYRGVGDFSIPGAGSGDERIQEDSVIQKPQREIFYDNPDEGRKRSTGSDKGVRHRTESSEKIQAGARELFAGYDEDTQFYDDESFKAYDEPVQDEALTDIPGSVALPDDESDRAEIEELRIKPMPIDVASRMPVHKISRISPTAAAVAQSIFNKLSVMRRKSEWFL